MDEIERYQQMNLLPSARIGWETKQAYIGRLIEAHSNEYLTDDEYDARFKWVTAAQTEEQIKLAFKDLPTLRVTGVELTPGTLHTPPKHNTRKTPTDMIIIGLYATLSGYFAIQGGMLLFGYFLILAIAMTVVYLRSKGR
jgi:hypothetical protein